MMKTVKIRCFSAINGEKTFVWNGQGLWDETKAIRFQTEEDAYEFRWNETTVWFIRTGDVPLELTLCANGRSVARLFSEGRRIDIPANVLRMHFEPSRFDVFYRMEGLLETHQIHLDWTLEGRN
jgi:hypothetical protein